MASTASVPSARGSRGWSVSTAWKIAARTRAGSLGGLPGSVVVDLGRLGGRAGGEVGAHRAGLDDRRAHAEVRDLFVQRFAEALDGELGGGVGALAGENGRDAFERGDLHDVAGALAAQLRQCRPGHVEHAEDVGLELPAQLVVGDLLERAEQAIAGVVDHDVDCRRVMLGYRLAPVATTLGVSQS